MTEEELKPGEDKRLRKDPRSEVWANWQGAVLLRDEIREYCKNDPKLIDPFVDDKKLLKPASYHLRLGDRCRVNGEEYNLSKGNPVLRIPPHGIAIVRTLEKVNIPGFLIASLSSQHPAQDGDNDEQQEEGHCLRAQIQ